MTYETRSITCPRCHRTSYHPDDIDTGYCGACHWWTSDPVLGAPEVIAQAELDGPLAPDARLDPAGYFEAHRELAARLAASHRMNIAAGVSSLALAFSALGPVMNRMIESFKAMGDTLERHGVIRRTTKRLRHGRTRVRYRHVYLPQPSPWKVPR